MADTGYQVLVQRNAEKQLQRLAKPFQQTVYQHMIDLALNPRPQMAKMLRGADRVWRLRVGDYRVLYEIDDGNRQVIVSQIGHRRDVYRGR